MSSGVDARAEHATSNITSDGRERFARRNINVLQDKLPAPEAGEWTVTDIGLNPWTVQDWVEGGIIKCVGTHPRAGCEANRYETTPGGWQALQAAPSTRSGPRLPCGHYGIHNPRDREGLECAYEDCTSVFEKHELQDENDENDETEAGA